MFAIRNAADDHIGTQMAQPNPTPSKLALSVTDFCTICSIGRSTFYLEVKAKRISILKVGKRTLVPAEEARRWLDSLPTR